MAISRTSRRLGLRTEASARFDKGCDPEIIDLHDVITAAHEMLLQLVTGGVDIDLHLDAGTTTIHADPSRIEQVLVNLVVNASDAMPLGGTLTIATSNPVSRDGAEHSVAVSVAGLAAILAFAAGTDFRRATARRAG